jgi:ATP-binding cassette subfamily B protein
MWAAGYASLKRMDEVLDSVPDVQDSATASRVDPSARADVELEDVSFSYPGERSEPVLRHVSFRAAQGQTFAILGATGAGKTSLVNLLARFYDVDGGVVRVFGRDVRELSQDSLLAQIGFVPQESVLFSGTVRDNIRYGRQDASEDEVLRAARAAQADAFILQLPHGYDTVLDQRGGNLSGGQRQRIAIARALLLDPKILILDDATSAVDVETETSIQSALFADKARRTTFIVAQRISTVLDADIIVVLDKGAIVAQGTHRELLAGSDVYREIYNSQLGASEELGIALREVEK